MVTLPCLLSSISFNSFVAEGRTHGEGHVINFTIITPWQSVMESVCGHWSLQPITISVRYTILEEHRTTCWIVNEGDFRMMCTVHYLYGKKLLEMEVNDEEGMVVRTPSAAFVV